ncbi:MAG: tRNA epoxyqueuosine(34) reductase QueG [Pirellulaceae bacterium]
MLPDQLAQSIKSAAREIGFDGCGICPASQPPALDRFHQWLEAGYHGEMSYLDSRREAYSHPRHVLDGAQSIVMLALSYEPTTRNGPLPGTGLVSRYAWGSRDYHDVIHERLKQLKAAVQDINPDSCIRGVVDSAPLLEREFAVLAGLGWQGKNTLILNTSAGSWFFLAALLLDFVVEYDAPHATDHCGTCRACLDACPTNAFVAPNLLDATRCISYLTIELREPIPVDLRRGMGNWVFGCDVCQDVCPWNNKAPETGVEEFQAVETLNPLNLAELFDLDDDAFRARFRQTPLWRSKRRGILRNAAIVLGNQGHSSTVPALTKGLNDPEPLIRGAAAWALGQIGDNPALAALNRRLAEEPDDTVRNEITAALEH